MADGVVAVLGLAAGVLIAFAGGEALTRAARGLLGAGAAAGLAATAASATPEYAFAVQATIADLPGAALGAVAGSITACALIAAVAAARGAPAPAPGARALAVAVVLGAASLIAATFDGEISQIEGGVMLVAALVTAGIAARLDGPPAGRARDRTLVALGLLGLGVLLVGFGAWLAINGVAALAKGRADGDLVAGLCALGLGAAAPEILASALAARRGAGGQALLNVLSGAALVLFGALGCAALVRPVAAPEAFLGLPAVAVGVSALVLLGLVLTPRPPRLATPLGLVAYLGFFAAFLGTV